MAVLKFYNEITNEEGKQFMKWCMGIDAVCYKDIDDFLTSIPESDNQIDIRLHCDGGLVTEGWAIHDKLRASGKEISAIAEGTVASMASVILLSAPLERRKAYRNARLLIHNPYIQPFDYMTADELRSAADNLQAEQDKILDLYVERTGQPREVLQALMNEDKYIDMVKAKELGFISEIIEPVSAKSKSPNSKYMNKEKEVTVSKSLLDKALSKIGLKRLEDVLNKEITTSTGDTLTIEREEGDPQVGDKASPDGEHVLEDGSKIIVQDGVITEIVPADSGSDELDSLKEENANLKQQLESLKAQAKSKEDNEILNAVKAAGGKEWLSKQCSNYKPSGKAGTPSAKKPETEEPQSKIDKKLAEIRNKKFNKYNS